MVMLCMGFVAYYNGDVYPGTPGFGLRRENYNISPVTYYIVIGSDFVVKKSELIDLG